MAYKVNSDTCINCGACEGECPNGAISEVNDKRAVASEKCISCGACASVCPVEAIAEE
ncbi:MAG: 4Fe-4S binding protein [Treponema sp.]|nr:4Fe-4S binding protein [Treponema sp.]MBQ6566181.1 4Fe-4S binding protein [Treponema sp.]MBQ7167494.1 4Fe-4S binding protein [Treponema sp.]